MRDEKQREMMLQKKKLGKGCFDTHTQKYTVVNIEYKTCLGNYTNTYINFLWEMFTHYENNLLPYVGTLGNQPAKIMEIFDIIQGIVTEYEKKLKAIRRLQNNSDKRLGNG